MKKVLTNLIISLFILLTMVVVAKAEITIGVVNIQKIMTTIKEGKAVNDKLQKTFDQKKAEIKKEEEKIKKDQEDLVKQASLLSNDAKQTKERKINEDIMKLQQKTMEYQRQIQGQEAELKKPILDKLKDVIDQVSTDEKVDMTIEVSASPVVYAKNKKELSDLVVKAYDKKYAK